MITDLLIILLAFIFGYAIFMSSTYFLAKWMLPRIEDEEDFSFPKSDEIQIPRAVSEGYLAK